MKEFFSYLAYSTAWRITKAIPARVAYGFFDAIALLMYRRNPSPVKRLRSNYSRVRPDLNERELNILVREGLRSYLRYWCDTFRLPSWSTEETMRNVVVENEVFCADRSPREGE